MIKNNVGKSPLGKKERETIERCIGNAADAILELPKDYKNRDVLLLEAITETRQAMHLLLENEEKSAPDLWANVGELINLIAYFRPRA